PHLKRYCAKRDRLLVLFLMHLVRAGRSAVRKNLFGIVLVAASLFFMNSYFTQAADPKDKDVILSTTTSTQDSGLLNELIPLFEKQSGYRVKTVAVGTGQALAMAAKGETDVALVHAPSLEKEYVAQGKLLNRRVVMYNDFIIIGPSNDPAKIKSAKSAVAALKLIEQSHAPFVSRGDNSGTHNLENSLWKSPVLRQRELGTLSRVREWGRRSTSPMSETP